MLKLIWRQVLKNKNQLTPILIIWIICGYFIFSYNHQWFGAVSRWWLDLPAVGEENPKRAYDYYLKAHERLIENHTNLRLMNKSCEEFLPYTFKDEIKSYRPHWLEKLNRWENNKLQTGHSLDSRTVEPDQYWKDNQTILLDSLKNILDALNYAYRIPASVQNSDTQKDIILASVFSSYARALCQPQLGRLVWGDYARFQELQAWKKFHKKQKLTDFPVNDLLRQKAWLKVLEGNLNYYTALQQYVAGTPPLNGNLSLCKSIPFRLSCSSPDEAIGIYKKLLLVVPENALDSNHLNLARTAWLASKMNTNQKENMLVLASKHFHLALLSAHTEQDALFELARLEIETGHTNAAWEHAKRLSIQSRRPGFPKFRFNKLARKVLIQSGRFKDADCYADLKSIRYGQRNYCKNLVF